MWWIYMENLVRYPCSVPTDVIRCATRTAFGFSTESGDDAADNAFKYGVDIIYSKGKKPTIKKITTALEKLLAHHIEDVGRADKIQANSIVSRVRSRRW